jgi:hypothetical protein
VRSAWNSGAQEALSTQNFVIMPMVTSVAITPNVVSPQPLGATVTWTASAAGGQPPYQYRWGLYDGTSWSFTTDWQSGNTYAWTPASANAGYRVLAHVRGSWNSGVREAASTEAFVINPRVTGVTITPSVTAPRAPGTTVTWTAAASGGEVPYQYQWWVYNGTAWTAATGWQAGNTYAWTPVSAHTGYRVQAWVRSAWNSGAQEAVGNQTFAIRPGVTSVTIAPSVTAPRAPGTTVTWTASPVAGEAPYQYQWAVYDGSVWTTTTGWQSGNTYAWTPSSANGGYQVQARVRSTWNSGALEAAGTQAFPIQPMVTSVALTPSVASPQAPGTTITWTAVASGGQSPLEYQWWVYNGTAWTAATGWQAGNTYAWTPVSAHTGYRVQAWVRSAWNSGAREAFGGRTFAIQ